MLQWLSILKAYDSAGKTISPGVRVGKGDVLCTSHCSNKQHMTMTQISNAVISKVAWRFYFSFAAWHFLILSYSLCMFCTLTDKDLWLVICLPICAVLQVNLHLVSNICLAYPPSFPHLVYTGFKIIFALVSTDKYWEVACKAIERKSCIKMFSQSCQHHNSSRKHVVPSPAELVKADIQIQSTTHSNSLCS